MGGRLAFCIYNGWPRGRPLRGDILAPAAPPYHSSHTGRYCAGTRECHWVFQPRREQPTPDHGFVTPTARLVSVSSPLRTSFRIGHPHADLSGTASSSSWQVGLKPGVPLEEERGECTGGGGGGDKFGHEIASMVNEAFRHHDDCLQEKHVPAAAGIRFSVRSRDQLRIWSGPRSGVVST
jgi:hypothetical protein